MILSLDPSLTVGCWGGIFSIVITGLEVVAIHGPWCSRAGEEDYRELGAV